MAEQPLAPPIKQRGRPRRPPSVPRVRVLTLRVPAELLRRLDAYTAQVQTAQPYQRVSRADVLRMLLDQGLPGGQVTGQGDHRGLTAACSLAQTPAHPW